MISPGSVIGIIGGGQLGKMLSIAAAHLGYHTHIFDPKKDAIAFSVSGTRTIAAYDNAEKIKDFIEGCDVITYEFENIDIDLFRSLDKGNKIQPSLSVLEIAQHRLKEKNFLKNIDIPIADFISVKKKEDLINSPFKNGILKTASLGYDGKGQFTIENLKIPDQVNFAEDFTKGFVFEQKINFKKELSIIVAKNKNGDLKTFPAAENIHKNGILKTSIAPGDFSKNIKKEAEKIAIKIAQELNLIGLLAVEFFLDQNNNLLVNEFAPRPHNSGHWTLDGCSTNQFEQTIRAICNLPLGNTKITRATIMKNLIGEEIKHWPEIIKKKNAKLYLYGKKEIRPARKLGHVNYQK